MYVGPHWTQSAGFAVSPRRPQVSARCFDEGVTSAFSSSVMGLSVKTSQHLKPVVLRALSRLGAQVGEAARVLSATSPGCQG